ncbi:MAG TPA: adenylyl-sulfate reductase subunit alpha [Firmicutes bacterium]|nr:adenylyl-sulfate reductase subunit alpha [Bacillota bacterium]HBG45053.1 adenylyl-sulfate reductase subunit alpha [Bacillota bacterium]HBL68982.1 adenylyl-sulfate reductase subunit alpha [Bacillota bacterium]HBR23965.1 adenylyl-sulfate reductase subunit alpha [Bacillota bacterium]HCF89384.1 adenylyl-sulfate reductase subunit alpha [Bacillota bacterium]
MAAATAKEIAPDLAVTVIEKAHIDRSGCLAAGMNAINAYLNPGETPESFTQFVRNDACGLIREDLVLSIAGRLNEMVAKVESWGLPVVKDADGSYKRRGRWNVEIFGESLKPILAEAVRKAGATVFNRMAVADLICHEGRVAGAIAFSVRDASLHVFLAKAVIVCTGGASGLYRPNNQGSAHHKIWYSPFNTGAGYAIGLRAGAEMTSLEMRFIALRTRDVIAPTGTLALGFGAPQVNALGVEFMKENYAQVGGERAPTPWRVYAPTREYAEGRGPCFLDTRGLSPERVRALKEAYLSMYPGIVLYWAANDLDPAHEPIEICGTEPYVMGGHCQAGYWIDEQRRTTLPGLYAAGDVSGGAPYKFVSGCWVEGAIAAETAVADIMDVRTMMADIGTLGDGIEASRARILAPYRRDSQTPGPVVLPQEAEERLQKIMDEYAGGLSSAYQTNKAMLTMAEQKLDALEKQLTYLMARSPHDLMQAHEVIDRLLVAQALVKHMLTREETRWPAFHSRSDFPERNDADWLNFVNTRYNKERGAWHISRRPYTKMV